jgi:hypothetical protein
MADITLNVTVPDMWVTRTLNAFNAVAGKDICIYTAGQGANEAKWVFSIEPKKPSENNKDFGERVVRELGKAVINMVDLDEDELRRIAELNLVAPATSDVPDDILT